MRFGDFLCKDVREVIILFLLFVSINEYCYASMLLDPVWHLRAGVREEEGVGLFVCRFVVGTDYCLVRRFERLGD